MPDWLENIYKVKLFRQILSDSDKNTISYTIKHWHSVIFPKSKSRVSTKLSAWLEFYYQNSFIKHDEVSLLLSITGPLRPFSQSIKSLWKFLHGIRIWPMAFYKNVLTSPKVGIWEVFFFFFLSFFLLLFFFNMSWLSK